jgi:catechol 2,3-dioxygenase-like lactoylglutathione lyase family enzyme
LILLRAATVTVADLDASACLYTKWLDYKLVERDVISRSLADSWGAPHCHNHRYVVLQPKSGKGIFLRLIEQVPMPGFRGLRTYGWNAIEICVTDVLSVHDRLKESPFEIIGSPRENAGLANIHPMQVRGPDEEIIFLTQINDDVPPFRLPRATGLIDQIFIMVIGCSDMEASCEWFGDHLGLSVGERMEIAYTMLSKAYGREPSTRFTLTTMVDDQDVFLEVDQYPQEATQRPCRPSELPPGIAMTTFWVPDLGRVTGSWIAPPALRSGTVYTDRRTGTMAGPDNALIEIVEFK